MATNGRIQLNITGSYEKTATGNTLKQAINERFDLSFLEGVGELQFNRYYVKSGTATTTPAVAIDLSGTDTDDFGVVTASTELVVAFFKHLTPGGGILLVGGGANDIADMGANFVRKVRPGINATTKPGFDLFVAPDASGSPIVATTSDKITVTASAGSIAWEALFLTRA